MTKRTPQGLAPSAPQGLSAEDTKKLLYLVKNAKSVELKLSVPMK